MLDLTKLTPDEVNKIEVALLCLEREIIAKAEASESASLLEGLDEETRLQIKSNGEWWREVHELIFKN